MKNINKLDKFLDESPTGNEETDMAVYLKFIHICQNATPPNRRNKETFEEWVSELRTPAQAKDAAKLVVSVALLSGTTGEDEELEAIATTYMKHAEEAKEVIKENLQGDHSF